MGFRSWLLERLSGGEPSWFVLAEVSPERARQLAEQLQVSESTINRLRRSGRIPALYVTDRIVRYNLKDVRKALGRQSERHAGDHEAPFLDDAQMGFDDLFADFDDTSPS